MIRPFFFPAGFVREKQSRKSKRPQKAASTFRSCGEWRGLFVIYTPILNGKDGCKRANPISDSCALPGRRKGRGPCQLCGHGGIRSGEKRGCPADRRIPGNGAGHERRHPRRLRTGADRLQRLPVLKQQREAELCEADLPRRRVRRGTPLAPGRFPAIPGRRTGRRRPQKRKGNGQSETEPVYLLYQRRRAVRRTGS